MLPEAQNKHFSVVSVTISHIARKLWAKENYFWNDPRTFLLLSSRQILRTNGPTPSIVATISSAYQPPKNLVDFFEYRAGVTVLKFSSNYVSL